MRRGRAYAHPRGRRRAVRRRCSGRRAGAGRRRRVRRHRAEDDHGPPDRGGWSPRCRRRSTAAKSLSINDIYRRAAPGVVQVQQQQQSLGSGFVVDKAGHIVTNYHVVDGAKQVRVSFSNGASMKATIVGTDPSTDLAVLKIDASSRALTPLPLGDSDCDTGRRPGRRDRQPVRPRPHRHGRDRQRDPARDHGAERLHDRPRRSRPTPRSTTATPAARC